MITDWFRSKPAEPTVEFVSLTESWSPGHFVDDIHYKLVIRIDGKTTVVKKTLLNESLTYKGYQEMLKKALPTPIEQMVKHGYKVVVRESFINSPIRRNILSDLTRKPPVKRKGLG